MEAKVILSGGSRRKCNQLPKLCAKKEKKASIKKVSLILRKCESQRTEDERILLSTCGDEVAEIESRQARSQRNKDRCQEVEDPPELLLQKCKTLAEAINTANHLVVYTGAGISTSAHIPDYRGSQGIWTLLQKGKDIGNHDLSQAEPTPTHMALFELHRKGLVKYVVSQNCDGLHLRSGLPKAALSEVHGNMYIEVCRTCQPGRQYWRLFDTTELTGRFTHKTRRKCRHCGGALVDSIVHFGERGTLPWPLNWKGAIRHSEKADVILCLGSSLKVLKRYPWLWAMDRPAKKRPKIYIVNLQWTPKDECAILKINGRCDEVITALMTGLHIDIPRYDRFKDPLFAHATPLHEEEEHTTTQPILLLNNELIKHECKDEMIENDNDIQLINSSAAKENKECIIKEENVDMKIENVVKTESNINTQDSVNYSENPGLNTLVLKNSLQIAISLNDKSIDNVIRNNDMHVSSENLPENLINTCLSTTVTSSNDNSIIIPKVCDKQFSNINHCVIDNNELPNSNDLSNGTSINISNISRHDILDKKSIGDIIQGKSRIDDVQETSKLGLSHTKNNSLLASPTKNTLFSIDSILSSKKTSRPNLELKSLEHSPDKNVSKYTINDDVLDFSKHGINSVLNPQIGVANKKLKLSEPPPYSNCTNENLIRSYKENKVNTNLNKHSNTHYGNVNNFPIDNNYGRTIYDSEINYTPRHLFNGFLFNPMQTSYLNQSETSSLYTHGYYEALLNYYEAVSQTMPQLSYSRLAYSGLHSIISPMESVYSQDKTAYQTVSNGYNNKFSHYSTEGKIIDNTNNSKNNTYSSVSSQPTAVKNEEKCKIENKEQYITNNAYDISQQIPKPPECDFCQKNYKSFICLFYQREQSTFSIKVERKGKIIFCVCCDYSDSSGDEKDEDKSPLDPGDDKLKVKNKHVDDIKLLPSDDSDRDSILDNEVEDKNDDKGTKVQAGWFGKGCRKNRRKKRA